VVAQGRETGVVTGTDVHTAAAADLARVLVLWRTAAENAGRPPDTETALVALLERDPSALLVAESGDQLVGSVIAGWDGWRGHLYRLAVHPDRRREGVGRALLTAAEARLRALGAPRFDAMVLDDNELGSRLWLAAGYHRQGDWGRWVKAAGPDATQGA
jgi:ribosomal protein S18 acetylase RimI-like enzyme